jgi:hypothetical protein
LLFKYSTVSTCAYGRAMAQAVSRRPPTAEARVRSRLTPCGICGGQSGTGTGFSPSTSVYSCQFHSTGAPLLGKGQKIIIIFIFITGLHNKPQGCGASIASAAGPFTTKKKKETCELSARIHLVPESCIHNLLNRRKPKCWKCAGHSNFLWQENAKKLIRDGGYPSNDTISTYAQTQHVDRVRPSRGPPIFITQLATTFLNCVCAVKITQRLGVMYKGYCDFYAFG